MLLSYCVVNTDGREHLVRCLDAIAATHPEGVEHEVLVLDNASTDGSAEAVRARGDVTRLIELERREGKAANDSTLLRAARGTYCLLLNEDAELLPGCMRTLLDTLESDPRAACAAPRLLDPAHVPQPCAWRFPTPWTALLTALGLHRRFVVQSRGEEPRRVDWAQSSALLVRRSMAAEVEYLDPAFFVYSDETDFQRRLADIGRETVFVPAARAVHHEQLSADADAARPRIVEFHRARDRYVRKHHGAAAALAVRVLTAWAYLVRAAVAAFLPRHSPARHLLHARQALLPGRGEGLRERAAAHNASLP